MLLFGLLLGACSDGSERTVAGSPTHVGGDWTDGDLSRTPVFDERMSQAGSGGAPPETDAGTSASGASGGVGGGAPNSTGTGGSGEVVDELPECRPSRDTAVDACEYPESLGGSADPTRCGVTPAAWYPLGDSELTSWPERAVWRSASGGGIDSEVWHRPFPHVAFDPEGRPVVAWVGDGLEVRRWQDGDWEILPPGAPDRSQERSFDMVLDRDGNPVVLEQYTDKVGVMRWADDAWVSLGEWPANSSWSERMRGQIALDEQDHPIVVYADGPRIIAKRWDGSSFQQLRGNGTEGSLSDNADPSMNPALALRQNGDIVVVWLEQQPFDGGYNGTWLLEFNGERWEPLGDSATGAGVAPAAFFTTRNAPTVAVDSDDQVIVAWDDWPQDSIRVWGGAAWSPAESGLSQPELIQSPEGRVYLAGTDSYAHPTLWVRQAGEWESVMTPEIDPWETDWAFEIGRDERFAVTWNDSEWNHNYLLVNTDGTWRELGEPTARGEGLYAGDGQHLVSGHDGVFLYDGICHVDRWDGETWQALDLSDWVGTLGDCGGSTLALSPTGQLVLALWVDEFEQPYDPEEEPDDSPLDETLYLFGWTEAGWEELADPFPYQGRAHAPLVTFDSSGAPLIAWSDPVPEHSEALLSVITLGETGWSTLLEQEHISYGRFDLRLLALPEGRVALQYNDWQDIESGLLYDAGEWHELPGLTRESEAPISLVHDTNGTPFMVWPTASGLALHQLSASSWEAVAADEARLSTLPEPIRTDVFSDKGEIYLRRFEECGWRGLSASDRGGGISNSVATSRSPSFSSYDGTTCVSWVERAESDSAQLVRCHD